MREGGGCKAYNHVFARSTSDGRARAYAALVYESRGTSTFIRIYSRDSMALAAGRRSAECMPHRRYAYVHQTEWQREHADSGMEPSLLTYAIVDACCWRYTSPTPSHHALLLLGVLDLRATLRIRELLLSTYRHDFLLFFFFFNFLTCLQPVHWLFWQLELHR